MSYALIWNHGRAPVIDHVLWKSYDSPWGRIVLWVWNDRLIRLFREDYPWTRLSFSASGALFETGQDVDRFFDALFDATSDPQQAVVIGSPFEHKVWQALVQHGDHHNLTYKDLACLAGSPLAARAVGTALGRNPLPLIIPCHRVVSQTGMGGFQWGLDEKRYLQQKPPGVLVTSFQAKV